MAILHELGLEVRLEIAGISATEHPVPENEDSDAEDIPRTKVHRCYIESQKGEEFRILCFVQ